MLLREFLKNEDKYTDYTFVIAKTVKDEHTPFYHHEFYQTPINTVHEWLKGETPDKYIVVKKDQAPVGVHDLWDNNYKKGWLKCCIITTETDLRTMYSEKQANDMLKYYDELMRK